MSTQLQQALKGIVTQEMIDVAKKENADPEWLQLHFLDALYQLKESDIKNRLKIG